MQSIIKKLRTDAPTNLPFATLSDWALFLFVLIVGGGFAYYIHQLGLMLFLVDQFSHISIGRQIADSITPGMSQIGFWPPLLHVLIAPFSAIDALYYSGYAGAALLVPVLGLSVVMLSRLIYLITGNRFVGYIASVALIANPYVLYFSVTPMTEMLFLGMLFGVAYFFARWWMLGNLGSLVLLGVFASLATVARFEGFVLLPILGIAILTKLLIDRRSYMHIEAVAITFGLIAITGLVFILAYGYIFGGDPLAFMNSSWGAYAQQRDFVLPGEGNVVNAVKYMGAAAVTMIGEPLIIVTLVELVLLALLVRAKRWLIAFVLLVLSGPFLFDILAVYQGSAIVYLPSLPPYPERFFNVRYGLFLIGIVILVPAIIAGILAPKKLTFNSFVSTGSFLAIVTLALLFTGSYTYGKDVVCPDCFDVVRWSNQVSPGDHSDIAYALKENYEGGYVLMTRALHNEVAVRAEVPLQNYILEANDFYFKQALESPWWYAQYVVMFNPNEVVHKPWLLEHEAVSKRWAKNDDFHYFYEEVFATETEALYKLRNNRLRSHAIAHEIEVAWIPVLSEESKPWDVEHTHLRIERALELWHERNS